MNDWNEDQRVIAVRVLRRAKTHLARNYREVARDDRGAGNRREFICHALGIDRLAGAELDAAEMLRDLIEDRLGSQDSLKTWLLEHHLGLFFSIKDGRQLTDKIQETRHRWVDALIEEFS